MVMQIAPKALGYTVLAGQLDEAPIDLRPADHRIVVRFGNGFSGRGELAQALRDLAQLIDNSAFRGDMERRP